MGKNSSIEWTDHTFNPWEGCQKVGPGCDHCYAETRNARFSGGVAVNWGPSVPRRRTSEKNWNLPLKWNAQAEREGRRFRVFCASLADVFDNAVPDEWRVDLFALIYATPHLDWMLLTKRIGNVPNMLPVPFDFDTIYPHVWIGATVVNQAEADRDIPKLLAVGSAKRFLSIEPMLGAVDLSAVPDGSSGMVFNALTGVYTGGWPQEVPPLNPPLPWPNHVDWVICGGESGPNARPMHHDWARSLRDQCASAGVPFLFKQWGEWTPGVNVVRMHGKVQTAELHEDGWRIYREDLARDDGHIDDEPDLYRVGKRAAGRQLDGIEHNGFPEVCR